MSGLRSIDRRGRCVDCAPSGPDAAVRARHGHRGRRVHRHQRSERERFQRSLGVVQRATRDDGRIPGPLFAFTGRRGAAGATARSHASRAGVGSRSAATTAGCDRPDSERAVTDAAPRHGDVTVGADRGRSRTVIGRFYDTGAGLHRQMVALLGSSAASQLGISSSLGNPAINISGVPLTVVGIVSSSQQESQALLGVIVPPYVATVIARVAPHGA